ncbi:hypothetical protein HORIV_59600 [Vreelandella olivaria]|uniref:Uncharacterized protein n=1 Tax=Vreelandella olivaria TaxID=390919 RepID=A0ABN5X2R7_9GAMM|nr:hypothetical protein HORIV_59600 [Halomonas olivaria]
MAAATVNIPAIVLSGGPMLNGWRGAERVGSGTIIWELRKRLAAGDIDYAEFLSRASDSAPLDWPLQHHGHRFHHELHGGSAGHEPAGVGGYSRPL